MGRVTKLTDKICKVVFKVFLTSASHIWYHMRAFEIFHLSNFRSFHLLSGLGDRDINRRPDQAVLPDGYLCVGHPKYSNSSTNNEKDKEWHVCPRHNLKKLKRWNLSKRYEPCLFLQPGTQSYWQHWWDYLQNPSSHDFTLDWMPPCPSALEAFMGALGQIWVFLDLIWRLSGWWW